MKTLNLIPIIALGAILPLSQCAKITECLASGKFVGNFDDYADIEDCFTYQNAVADANSALDSSLCPSFSTMRSCIKQIEPQIAKQFFDCALEDSVEGELCLTPEQSVLFLEAAVPELIREYGEVCVPVVTEELILLEVAALKYYGCSDYYGDVDYQGMTQGEGPAFSPFSYDYITSDGVPDLLQICYPQYQGIYDVWESISTCEDMLTAFNDAISRRDESLCPSFELIETCQADADEDFAEILTNCVASDVFEGESCLSPEKYAKVLTRALTKFHTSKNVKCLDESIHQVILAFATIIEVAGCKEFVDEFAEGPYAANALFGLEPSDLAPYDFPIPPGFFGPNGFAFPPVFFAPFPAFGPSTFAFAPSPSSFFGFDGNTVPVFNPVPVPIPVPVPVPVNVPVEVETGSEGSPN